MANRDLAAFEAAAQEVGFLGFGFYPRSGFTHVDLGPIRQWGERFPVREMAFAPETPPAREVLAETQSAILPLVPYLDTLRWAFIAVALGGIAVMIYARLDDWCRGQR